MSMAMMRYMPLRGMLSFGSMTLEDLDRLVQAVNR